MKFVKKKRKFYSFLKNTLNSTNNMANLNKDFTKWKQLYETHQLQNNYIWFNTTDLITLGILPSNCVNNTTATTNTTQQQHNTWERRVKTQYKLRKSIRQHWNTIAAPREKKKYMYVCKHSELS